MQLLEHFRDGFLVGLAQLLVGCAAGPLLMMPTPNVHLDPSRAWYADLAPR